MREERLLAEIKEAMQEAEEERLQKKKESKTE